MLSSAELTLDRFLEPNPPKAAQLIVTIYGDIVEPRGGVLWMGDLISLCAGFGVNESLVRTAVSRLVAKDQLAGVRDGRRSFYALTPRARSEFHQAAELFFAGADEECGWIISHCSRLEGQGELTRQGFARLGGDVFAAPDRRYSRLHGTAFRAETLETPEGRHTELARDIFGLPEIADEYARFRDCFAPLAEQLPKKLAGAPALLFRLALVHAYRNIRLRDPRLPPSVLPDGWPGHEARMLFSDLYCRLSTQADRYIGQHLLNREGALPETTPAVAARLTSLRETN